MNSSYDCIVIGAGSVGVPAAMSMAEQGLNVRVIDANHSPGQMNNKKAIGGIRATHSEYGKIQVGLRSIQIFSTWKEMYGDDIGWLSNGYSFPAYNDADEKKLNDLMIIQHKFGLNIRWISAQEYSELVPGINMEGLRGAAYSPEDGSASPLKAISAFYFRSLEMGAEYGFGETVTGFRTQSDRITHVITNKGVWACGHVVNAAGNNAHDVSALVGIDLPVKPDNHEGAITEPVRRFFEPMVVDMRPAEDSLNYYFYQNDEGQVIFCITPDPPIYGVDNDSTSGFFPQVARRMIQLYPRLAYLKVRRSWRGQYPNTPDGFPVVGRTREYPNFINLAGMCGQGFMLGPGFGELTARIVSGDMNDDDDRILERFDLYRDFTGMEMFK
jgi:sarcosine oxidase, subunit beta